MNDLIALRFKAHMEYIIPRVRKESSKIEYILSYNYITQELKLTNDLNLLIRNLQSWAYNEEDYKVLELFEEIVFNMRERFHGRSGNIYMEKLY